MKPITTEVARKRRLLRGNQDRNTRIALIRRRAMALQRRISVPNEDVGTRDVLDDLDLVDG